MIRSLLFWLTFAFIILTTHLVAPILSVFFKKEEIYSRSAVIGSKILLFVGGIRVAISGLENIFKEKGPIFFSNHQSSTDMFILMSFLPRNSRFVIMQQIFSIPFFHSYLERAGSVMLDLSDTKRAFLAMRKLVSLLRHGESILIFPEGSRSPNERLLEFKDGASMLVLEASKTVVPIAILNSFKVMQRDELYGLRLRPGQVKVKIGEPMAFNEFQDVNLENARIISARLRETIEHLMHVE